MSNATGRGFVIAHDGRKICVGWSEAEILWLRAAIFNGGNAADYMDIASMSGRSLSAVRHMSYKLSRIDRAAELQARETARIERKNKSRICETTAIKGPTMDQLMAGSTRLRTYNAWTT